MKRQSYKVAASILGLLGAIGLLNGAHGQSLPQQPTAASDGAAAADVTGALCQIVYQVDHGVPASNGFRYLFYGNGFFINKGGYLLTAGHVLSQLHGAQPVVLLRDAAGQPEFVQAKLVAIDRDHDVAVLQATPNPFERNAGLSFLPLAVEAPLSGQMVQADGLLPSVPQNAFSLDPVNDERSPGEVLRFEFSQLGTRPVDTELFLFNHAIRPGQSGSPVIFANSRGVAGFVEGQWLRGLLARVADEPAAGIAPTSFSEGTRAELQAVPGVAVPIHYAIALLQQKQIAWQPASEPTSSGVKSAPEPRVPAEPTPLSLIAVPYPVQSFFGGEVLLDAQVNANGTVSDVKVLQGDQPFLANTLDAVHTWTFVPTPSDGDAAGVRIAIDFQFPQPYLPPRHATEHHYDSGSASAAGAAKNGEATNTAAESAARPLFTVEPAYPSAGSLEGAVIVEESIDSKGRVVSARPVIGDESLIPPAVAAAKQWRFAPATHSGAAVDSKAIVVIVFRHPLATSPGPQQTRENTPAHYTWQQF